ncbi:MAG: hypothetical protein AMJ78_06990, partial [Omnitrophica WOR_2 bacterium SM23_29]
GKRVIGIDIGAGSVKFVELEKSAEGIQLHRAKFFDLTHLAEQDKREAVIREGLEGLLKAEKIKGGKTTISLSGQSVFIRFLKLPRIKKGKKDKIIKYEAQQQVPFPLEKIIWDYHAFRFVESPEEDVLLVAVKNEIVESALSYLSKTNLEIEFVDVSSLSLFNAVAFNEPLKQGIILDIGAKATNLIAIDEKGFWVRSILIAGDEMTHAISSNLKIPFDKAEELKRKEGTILTGDTSPPAELTPAGRDISNILNPLLSDLVSSIIQSLEFYRTRYGRDFTFNEAILCGGGSKLKGMEDFLSKYLGMSVKRPNLTKRIKCSSNLRLDLDFQTRFGAAIGSALRPIQKCPINIDLLPRERKIERDFKKKRTYVIASGILLSLIPFTLGLNFSSQHQYLRAQLKSLDKILSKYDVVQNKINALTIEIKNTKAKIRPFDELAVKRTLLLEALLEIEKLLPYDTWVTALKTDFDTVTLEGQTTSTLLTITEFKNKLESSDLFESVNIESASFPKETKQGDSQVRNFSIKFKLKGKL